MPPSPLKWEVFKTWLQPVLAGPELPSLLHAAIFISLPRPISCESNPPPPLLSLLFSPSPLLPLTTLLPSLPVAAVAVVSPALYAAVTVAQHMQRSFNAAPLYQYVSMPPPPYS